MCVCVYVCMYVCVCVCMCMYVRVCMCVYHHKQTHQTAPLLNSNGVVQVIKVLADSVHINRRSNPLLKDEFVLGCLEAAILLINYVRKQNARACKSFVQHGGNNT